MTGLTELQKEFLVEEIIEYMRFSTPDIVGISWEDSAKKLVDNVINPLYTDLLGRIENIERKLYIMEYGEYYE